MHLAGIVIRSTYIKFIFIYFVYYFYFLTSKSCCYSEDNLTRIMFSNKKHLFYEHFNEYLGEKSV